jgi:hypothetical protein
LAALVTAASLWMEYLNAAAGSVLPSHEYCNSDPSHGVVKMRYSPIENETEWRSLRGPRDENGMTVRRPLRPEEQAQMEQDVKRALAWNELLGFLRAGGAFFLLLAIPIVFLVSLFILVRPQQQWMRWVASGNLVVVGLALLQIIVRRYWDGLY